MVDAPYPLSSVFQTSAQSGMVGLEEAQMTNAFGDCDWNWIRRPAAPLPCPQTGATPLLTPTVGLRVAALLCEVYAHSCLRTPVDDTGGLGRSGAALPQPM
jgi:hypothetical protein